MKVNLLNEFSAMDRADIAMDFSDVMGMIVIMRIHYAGQGARPIRALPIHHHEPWIVIAYSYGKGETTFAHESHRFAPGTVLCVPPRMPYAERSVRGFNAAFIAADGLPFDVTRVHRFEDGDQNALALAQVIVRTFNRNTPPLRALAEQLLESLMRLLTPENGAPSLPPPVKALCELIHRGWANPEFNLAAAMRAIPQSEAHLRRTFTRAMKLSPVRYLLEYRMTQARRLLSIGGYTVKEVSYMCGFADPYYFSRAFRNFQKCSPTQWLSRSK